MRKLILLPAFILFGYLNYAQIGINNTNPQASLDITASNPSTPANTDGILIPRVDAFPNTNPGVNQQGMMVYLTTTSGSNPPGFYYWDNTSTSWKSIVGTKNTLEQAYNEGGPGNGRQINITNDRIELIGNSRLLGLLSTNITTNSTSLLTIGATLNSDSGKALSISLFGTNPTTPGVGSSSAIYNYINHNAVNGVISGLKNLFALGTSSGAGSLYGYRGVFNDFYSIINPNGYNIGTVNKFTADTYFAVGVENHFRGNAFRAYGLWNHQEFSPDAEYRGVFNEFLNNSTTGKRKYGVYTIISGSGSGLKYGSYINIASGAGGTHYGVYADAQKATGYAGYFIGRMSLGNSTTNRYLMPAADGTVNQIMATDGAGNVSFVNPSSVFNQDSDWFTEGTTSAPNAITDDIFTQGNVAIGKNIADYALDVEETRSTIKAVNISKTDNASVLTYGISLTKSSSGTGQSRGIHINLTGSSSGTVTALNNYFTTSGNGEKIGVNNLLPNSGVVGGNRIGIKNTFPISPTGISQYGVYTIYGASAQGNLYGLYNDFNTLNTYSNTQYGTYNYFRNSQGNTKYGTFSIFDAQAGGNIWGNYVEINAEGVTGTRKAYEAIFGANATNTIIGLDVDMNTTGAQTKYGVRVDLTPATGSSNYGIHSTVQTANGFAGYFVGNSYFSNRIGINTSNPNYRLSVAGTANLNEGIASGSALRVNGAEALWYNGTYFSWGFGGTANYFADNVGIGTTTPDTKLSVAGIISGASDATEVNRLELAHGGANGYINNVGAGNLDFRHEGVTGMTFTDQLRVGIGTTSPTASLQVKSNSTSTLPQLKLEESQANDGARVHFINTLETTNKWTLYGRADNTIADSRFNIHHTTTGNILIVTGDGNVGIRRTPTTNDLEVNGTASKTTAGSWLANSDKRLKKDITNIKGSFALNKINQMRGVTYKWNDDKTGIKRPSAIQYGFIAQDLLKVFPSKVSKDNLGYYQTAYGDYDPLFVEAIKELNKKIDVLEEENKQLKEKLARQELLEERLEKVEAFLFDNNNTENSTNQTTKNTSNED